MILSLVEVNTAPSSSVPGFVATPDVLTSTVAVAARVERGVYPKCFASETTESLRTALSKNISFETIFA